MEPTYTMIGADGQQYGPIDLATIRTWVSEGRITAETKILRSDRDAWLPASNYSELGLQPVLAAQVPAVAGAAPGMVAAAPVMATARPAYLTAARGIPQTPTIDPSLEPRVRRSANWFFWIAGLSLVNTFISLSGKSMVFVAGLGITQIVDGVVAQLGANNAITLVINVIIASVFVLIGVFATKRHTWAFIVGMVLYGLDAPISLALGIVAVVIHGLVLWWIFKGLRANMELNTQKRGLAG